MKNLTRKTTFYGTDDEIKNRPNFKITKQTEIRQSQVKITIRTFLGFHSY